MAINVKGGLEHTVRLHRRSIIEFAGATVVVSFIVLMIRALLKLKKD